MTITPEGGRVLGCLVEKQLTTPQQYPLTRNALALACSQATNREPVMALDETAVQGALEELKQLRLVRFVLPSHGKSVTRYRHVLDEAHGLDTARVALVAMLLLRGPQTLGELRGRTARMVEFDAPSDVRAELEVLAGQPDPLVRLLPPQPGQKEERWQQLLASEGQGMGPAPAAGPPLPVDAEPQGITVGPTGPVDTGSAPVGPDGPGAGAGAGDHRADLGQRVEVLTAEVADLREELDTLRASLLALRESLGE